MKLLELQMLNFMPYGGEHRVRFPTDPSRNVMVLFGENMRGKTSLLNAIRWCLFGTAIGRHRKTLDLAKMVNSDSAAAGDHNIHVYLKFEENGFEYDLRRVARPHELVGRPRGPGDFRIDTSLRKDGTVLRGDEVEHELNQMMPEQTSRFFLFDGELLQEYEALLSDERQQIDGIKDAIEQVLGVPALTRGRDELRFLLRQGQSLQAKENKHVAGLNAMAEQQLQWQAQIASFLADISRLKNDEGAAIAEIDDLDEKLAATEAVQRAKIELDSLKTQRNDAGHRELQLKEDLLGALKDVWKDLLQPRLGEKIGVLERQRDQFRSETERLGSLKHRIQQAEALLAGGPCDVCGEPLGDARRSSIGAQLGRLQSERADLETELAGLGLSGDELSALNRLRSVGAGQRVRSVETSLNRVGVEIATVEGRLSEVEKRVRGHDTAEIARVRALRDARHQALGRIKSTLSNQQQAHDALVVKQNDLSRLMSKNTAARAQRINREVEVIALIERTFSQSVDVLRDRLKRRVEERASETFRELTSEKTYRGLQINDSYGLSIIDGSGREVSIRSAGAEQIVALSLIDGLNHTARKSGPIVMDTPLGRLDPKHRDSVLRALPRMADQVVLLVHEGEINRVDGIRPFAERIGAAYEIERVSATQSRLKNLRETADE